MEEFIKLIIKLKLFWLYEKVLLVHARCALKHMFLTREASPTFGLSAGWLVTRVPILSPFVMSCSESSGAMLHLWGRCLGTMRSGTVILSSSLLQEEIWCRRHDAIAVQYRGWRASVEFIEFLWITVRREVLGSWGQGHHKLRWIAIQITELLLLDEAREMAKAVKVLAKWKVQRRRYKSSRIIVLWLNILKVGLLLLLGFCYTHLFWFCYNWLQANACGRDLLLDWALRDPWVFHVQVILQELSSKICERILLVSWAWTLSLVGLAVYDRNFEFFFTLH